MGVPQGAALDQRLAQALAALGVLHLELVEHRHRRAVRAGQQVTPRPSHQVVVHERPDGEHVVVGEEGGRGEVTPTLADEPDV
mgnify:CR=1 FL=1